MIKSLYGLLKSELLFYKKIVEDMEACGFSTNPYTTCIYNAFINGKHVTVTWHGDELKLSRKDPFDIIKIALYLALVYGNKLKPKIRKVCVYLGMDLYFSEKAVLKVLMIKHLKKVLDEFPEEIKSTSNFPAADHLFHIR